MRRCKMSSEMMMREVGGQQSVEKLIPDWKTLLVVLICIAVDTIFLYGVTDYLFYQSAMMSVITAVAIAFGLDAMPVVIAGEIQKKQKNWYDVFILVMSVILFFGLVVAVFALRWTSMEVIYSSEDTISLAKAVVESSDNVPYVASDREKVMTAVLSIIPVITSAVTFASATYKPVSVKRFEKMQKNKLKNKERKLQLTARINETKRELSRDLDELEKQKYEVQVKMLEDMQEILGWQARTAVAMKIGTPEAVTALLEGEDENE